MRHPLLVLTATLALSGCWSGAGSAPESISDLERKGVLPTLDRSDSLAGPDKNGDGIRDDVERYIERDYSGEDEKAAARQFARAMRKIFKVDLSDLAAVKRVNQQVTNAIVCAQDTFKASIDDLSGSQVTERLEALHANTRARSQRYMAFSKALDGTTWSLPTGNGCEH